MLIRKGKLVIGNYNDLKHKILLWLHDSHQGGHAGVTATVKRITRLFYWHKLKKEVAQYIKNYPTCQKCKSDLAAYPGLLQPLAVTLREYGRTYQWTSLKGCQRPWIRM